MSKELTKAVYDALTAALSVSVYTAAPLDTALPYVDIGDTFAGDWSTKTFDGSDTNLTIDIWSDYQGSKEALDIAAQIKTALHKVDLTVTGSTLVLIWHQSTNVFRDADEETIHGVMEFRILTHE